MQTTTRTSVDVQPCCGNCAYYDNGICDKTGYIVYGDDYPRCSSDDRDWSWVPDAVVVNQ